MPLIRRSYIPLLTTPSTESQASKMHMNRREEDYAWHSEVLSFARSYVNGAYHRFPSHFFAVSIWVFLLDGFFETPRLPQLADMCDDSSDSRSFVFSKVPQPSRNDLPHISNFGMVFGTNCFWNGWLAVKHPWLAQGHNGRATFNFCVCFSQWLLQRVVNQWTVRTAKAPKFSV